MSESPFTLDPETVVSYCDPPGAGEQALQRIRMEHQFGMGPFTGRADRGASIAESLAYVDAYWGAWGENYLTGVLAQFGVRRPDQVTDQLGGLRLSTPTPDDIDAHDFGEADD
jgi:hypothetical protein